MPTRQTRIFVPPVPPYEDTSWRATLVASVVVPTITKFPQLQWYWLSEYVARRDDSGDCDIAAVPVNFGVTAQCKTVGAEGYFRSLRLRYQIGESDIHEFEEVAARLIKQQGCVISDFRDYSYVEDLGGNRFFGGTDSVDLRTQRARRLAEFLFALCRLYADSLVGPDTQGHYATEVTHSDQNPQNSPFESIHHPFCNITNVPTRVLVSQNPVGTDYLPPGVAQGPRVIAIPVKF